MTCLYCKADIKPGLKFCTHCGQSLEGAIQEGTLQESSAAYETHEQVSSGAPSYGGTGQQHGPGRWLYALSALILVVGVASFVLVLLSGLKSMENSLARIVVPGKYDINLKEPGNYIIFYEYQSVVGGKIYNTGQKTPNMRCNILSKMTGQPVPLSSPSASYSYSTGRSGIGVLEFTAGQTGPYEISAWYPEENLGPEIVLAIGKGFGTRLMTTILTCIAILGGSIVLAAVIFVVTLIKRRRARQTL
ncbi:MAG: hypothetical protein NTX75_06670 [Proteobacteria bacterium]|nr:hypothetical protein [Pseudomonadota bacterium]